MEKTACCFIGQKYLEPTKALKDTIRLNIIELIGQGVKSFYSGGETGFDILCANTVIELRQQKYGFIRLNLVIPCPNWINMVNLSFEERRTFLDVLGEADGLENVSPIYHNGCTAKRSERILQCSDVCLYFPEESNSDGTSQLIEAAREQGLEMIEISK